MISTKKLRIMNQSLKQKIVPKELSFNNENYEVISIDWSKVDYNRKEKDRHPFDVFFESLF